MKITKTQARMILRHLDGRQKTIKEEDIDFLGELGLYLDKIGVQKLPSSSTAYRGITINDKHLKGSLE